MSSFQLGQSGRLQGGRKIAAQFPEFLAGLLAERGPDVVPLQFDKQLFQIRQFRADRARLAVQVNQDVGLVVGGDAFSAEPARGGEGERVGDLQRGREETGLEDFLDRAGRLPERAEPGGKGRAGGREREEPERGLGDDPRSPSLPVKRPTRSKPVLFCGCVRRRAKRVRRPAPPRARGHNGGSRRISGSAGPPALVAMLPPMVHSLRLAGSGG